MPELERDQSETVAALSFSRLSLTQRQCLSVAKESLLERGKSGWKRAFQSKASRAFGKNTVTSLVNLGFLEKTSHGRMFCTEAGKAELLKPMPPLSTETDATRQRSKAFLERERAADRRRYEDSKTPQPVTMRLPYADN